MMMLNSQRLLTAFAVFTAVGYAQSGSVPATPTGLSGFGRVYPNEQVVNYVGSDGNIYELDFTSSWSITNRTLLLNQTLALKGSPVVGLFELDNTQHAFYIGSDHDVHDLFLDSEDFQYHDLNMTTFFGGPQPVAGSPLAAYTADDTTTWTGTKHVNFIGADSHVHAIWFFEEPLPISLNIVTEPFAANDLTELAGAPDAAAGSPLDGYFTPFNNRQHVDYIGTDSHVHELCYDTAWHHNDLTLATGAPLAKVLSIDGYITSYNNQQHVNYIGVDNHIHELWYDTAWHHDDLTQATGATVPIYWGALTGFQTDFNSQQHVDYIDTDFHVHELYNSNGWHSSDLTALTGGAYVQDLDPITGYVTEFNQQQHINYVGADNHIHELRYANGIGWTDIDVTRGLP